jgi:hypothetical protein
MTEQKKKVTYTYTAQFLLPLLGINKALFKTGPHAINYNRLVNVYLNDTMVTGYKFAHLFVIHHNFQDVGFQIFEDTLTSNENYIDEYDICNGELSVKIFKIPEEFEVDYIHFTNGDYSKFSEKAVNKILTNNIDINDPNKRKVYKGIFEKALFLKNYQEKKYEIEIGDSEVWSKYTLEKNVITPELRKALCKGKITPDNSFEE